MDGVNRIANIVGHIRIEEMSLFVYVKCHWLISNSDNSALLLGISNLSIRYTETDKCCNTFTIAQRLFRSRYHLPIAEEFVKASTFSNGNNTFNHFRQHMISVLTLSEFVYCNLSRILECMPLFGVSVLLLLLWILYVKQLIYGFWACECACMCMFCHPA